MKPAFSAVLVNYNSGGELRRALESIDRESAGPWEGVVVDNASTDGSERTAVAFESTQLLRNRENVGFGRGVNQGVAACTADRILIMNPDCRLATGALPPLMAVLDADPRCAIAAPRILDPDGSPQGNARGDPDMLTGLFGRTSTLRRSLSGLDVARRNVITADAPTEVDWVSGACMLVRRDALASVGGFDERYFMYWEDADLCRRLRDRGYTILYVPGSSAVHQVGQSSRTARASSIRAFHDSAYLYYATHVAPGALNPKRWIAHALLGARCWWKLRSST
ncbi:MAG TPA: glycosyltransferase family 2 protein [Vicinamibacterales bacterium]|nr:glycosyltransferase family 2 protein [Vicinamibacterales bacterium]